MNQAINIGAHRKRITDEIIQTTTTTENVDILREMNGEYSINPIECTVELKINRNKVDSN